MAKKSKQPSAPAPVEAPDSHLSPKQVLALGVLNRIKARQSGQRNWQKYRIEYPEPKVRRKKVCDACETAGIADILITCRICKAPGCLHNYKMGTRIDNRFADGTGICHGCRREREAAFKKHFNLGETSPANEES